MNDPKDPQAGLPKSVDLIISETMLHTSGVIKKYRNPAIHPPEMQQELDAIYHEALADIQAHQQQAFRDGQLDCPKAGDPTNHAHYGEAEQQLLTELLGELPKKRNGGSSKDFLAGRREVIDQVVSVIQSKIGELNG